MSETFKIHLQGTADTQQWAQGEAALKKLDTAATHFIDSIKQGVGIDLGGKLVNGIGQLQGLFTGFVERGYEFNKVMAQSEGGIANVLAKFMNLDAQAAKQEAAKAMAAIMEWEPKAAGSLQDLTLGFMSTVGAAQAAGIGVTQNVELVGKFANALAALGMDASQLTQELRAIFTGNITNDAQLAKTLQITPQAVKSAKEAGTFYEFLNKQIGKLGDTAAGPAVVLSSLNSSIDKASGDLANGLFNEVISGAEDLTKVLDDPDIKEGLKEVGVDIGKLVEQGVNLSVWAVQNAPLLLRVAEAALKVGGAIAAIKLTTIIAGLALKAQRWAMVTAAVQANTTALAANSAAANANATAGVGGAAGRVAGAGAAAAVVVPNTAAATAAGKAGGVAMATGWAAGFKATLSAALPLIILGLTMKIMSQGGEIMSLLSEWDKTNKANSDNLQNRKDPTEYLRDAIGKASTPKDVEEARRLGEIMQRDAKADGNEVLLNQLNAIMSKFDELVGKQVDHKKATEDAEAAEKAFAAALLEGKAAAGDNAAKIDLAAAAVDNLAKKLGDVSGSKVDTSSFESLLKSLQELDKTKLSEEDAKNVAKLIDLAGNLRDLKADAAKEAESQAEKQKKAADDLREAEIKKLELQSRAAEAADKEALARDLKARAEAIALRAELEAQGMAPATAAGVVKAEQGKDQAKRDKEAGKEQYRKELAVQVADLEDKIAERRAEGDKAGERALQDRLSALNLARQLEDQLGISRADAEDRARARVANERAASERDELKNDAGKGGRKKHHVSQPDPWMLTHNDGLRSNGKGPSSLDGFEARQQTSLRTSFEFPALDAFADKQKDDPGAGAGAAGATPQKDGGKDSGGGNSNVAGAAKQAADAAAKARDASAKSDAQLLAEIQRLSNELKELAQQHQQTASQLANNRS